MSFLLGHRRSRRGVGACFVALTALLRSLGGCGQTVEVGVDDPLATAGRNGEAGAVATGGSSGGGVGGTAEAGSAPCEPTLCRGKTYECGDCEDNDGDGRSDSHDADCLGPCDDDEAALSTGLTKMQTGACRLDCYFDGDNGVGNDKCLWSHICDPVSVAPDYPPSGDQRCAYDPTGPAMGVDCSAVGASQARACLDTCLPLVPNGCDCFGCCELPGESGNFHFIGGGRGAQGCTLDSVDDAEKCPVCTPVDSCMNACEACETCVGRPAPPECEPNRGCPVGNAACATDALCDFGEYCVTGCCVRAPEPT